MPPFCEKHGRYWTHLGATLGCAECYKDLARYYTNREAAIQEIWAVTQGFNLHLSKPCFSVHGDIMIMSVAPFEGEQHRQLHAGRI